MAEEYLRGDCVLAVHENLNYRGFVCEAYNLPNGGRGYGVLVSGNVRVFTADELMPLERVELEERSGNVSRS